PPARPTRHALARKARRPGSTTAPPTPPRAAAVTPTKRHRRHGRATSPAAREPRSNPEPCNEEAGGSVHVGPRQQELRPLWMSELRPLLPERLRRQPGHVDDGFVFVGVERADRVHDRAAGPHAVGGRPQPRTLQL